MLHSRVLTPEIPDSFIICRFFGPIDFFSPTFEKVTKKINIYCRTFLIFMHYYFFDNCAVKTLLALVDIDRKTVFSIKNKIEKIICRKYDESKEKIGGYGKILEIDETRFLKENITKEDILSRFGYLVLSKETLDDAML
ncbi:hypothetical protein DMUE_5297 [Dictyocoela muelleri]|nr:hypothetical protein DMUE_5297 [Dictyocoela muelleri]